MMVSKSAHYKSEQTHNSGTISEQFCYHVATWRTCPFPQRLVVTVRKARGHPPTGKGMENEPVNTFT